uniref:Thioredoxin domain-containing protein n=1 Tax=Meloidogyne javanica TaxID=6303 RepID=A0A915MNP2_MELJA
MLNIRFPNFVKRTVSAITPLFGQPTKMPLLVKNYNCYLPTQYINYSSLRRFENNSFLRCGPCQSFAPRLEAKVSGQGGKILLAKINVEGGASSLAQQFEVVSIPTIVCFKNGEFFDRIEGAVEDSDLDVLPFELKKSIFKNMTVIAGLFEVTATALAGHDATRALGRMNIKLVKDEYDDHSEMTADDLEEAKEWEQRLSFKYPLVGRLLAPGESTEVETEVEKPEEKIQEEPQE